MSNVIDETGDDGVRRTLSRAGLTQPWLAAWIWTRDGIGRSIYVSFPVCLVESEAKQLFDQFNFAMGTMMAFAQNAQAPAISQTFVSKSPPS